MKKLTASESAIGHAISEFGYSMRTLIQVLNEGPTRVEQDIKLKVGGLPFVNLSSLMRPDAENAGVVTYSLLVSRSLDQPQPGSTQYLVGDVLQPAVASPAVWKKLLGKCPTCSTSSAEFQRRLQAQNWA
jgi:hypothetical protein